MISFEGNLEKQEEEKNTFIKKLEKVVKRDFMRFQPEFTPNSLINVQMPMQKRPVHGAGPKFNCPDKSCTVCKTHFATLQSNMRAEGQPEDFVLDRLTL